MSQSQTPYIGSKISLISKLDIRYEGTLYSVDSNESTIALSKVKSFGTEDRPSAHPVPGRDEIYEFIIFKASDIKDLIVCEVDIFQQAKPPPTIAGLPYDPAIVSVSQKQPQSVSQSKPVGSTAAAANEKCSSAFRPVIPTNPLRATDSHAGVSGRSYAQPAGNNGVPNYAVPKANHPIPPLANPHQLPRYDRMRGDHEQRRGSGGWEESKKNTDHQRPLPYRQQTGYRQVHQAPDPPSSYRQGGGWGSQPRSRAVQSSTHHSRDAQKLQGDFDFEKANEKFEEKLHHLISAFDRANIEEEGHEKNIDDQPQQEKPQQDASHLGESNEENEEDEKDAYYDKTSSFFDKISCEALEKEEGRNNRPDWKKERMTNEETFGHSFFMRTQGGYRKRGGYASGRPPYGQQRRYGHEGGGYSFGRMGGGAGYSRGGPNNRRYPNQQRQPQATEG